MPKNEELRRDLDLQAARLQDKAWAAACRALPVWQWGGPLWRQAYRAERRRLVLGALDKDARAHLAVVRACYEIRRGMRPTV